MSDLLLAKVVVVPGKETLTSEYESNYIQEADMYIFFSEASYNHETGSYSGVRLLHDRIISENRLTNLTNKQLNYISIDIKPTDRRHTYFSMNRRAAVLSQNQICYLKNLFKADY